MIWANVFKTTKNAIFGLKKKIGFLDWNYTFFHVSGQCEAVVPEFLENKKSVVVEDFIIAKDLEEETEVEPPQQDILELKTEEIIIADDEEKNLKIEKLSEESIITAVPEIDEKIIQEEEDVLLADICTPVEQGISQKILKDSGTKNPSNEMNQFDKKNVFYINC